MAEINREEFEEMAEQVQEVVKQLGQQEKDEGVLMPYFRAFLKKTMENFASAKMLMFFFPFFTSAYFLYELFGMVETASKITNPATAQVVNQFFNTAMNGFTRWCTFTVSLGGSILVVREVFKVNKLNALNDSTKDTNEDIDKIPV